MLGRTARRAATSVGANLPRSLAGGVAATVGAVAAVASVGVTSALCMPPPKFDDVGHIAKNITGLDPVEGVKVEVSSSVQNAPGCRTDYEVSAAFANPQQKEGYFLTFDLSNTDMTDGGATVCVARYDMAGEMYARAIRQVGPFTLSAQTGLSPDGSTDNYAVDGSISLGDFTLAGRHTSMPHGKSTSVNYMQYVTPTVAMGTEILVRGTGKDATSGTAKILYHPVDPTKKMALDEYTLSIATNGIINTTYTRTASPHLVYATDFMLNAGTMRSAGIIGMKFGTQDLNHTATLSTEGVAQGVTEVALTETVKMSLGGSIDHLQGKSKIGVTFKVGS